MPREIESKYIPINNRWLPAFCKHVKVEDIEQGYVRTDNDMRVHIDTNQQTGECKAFLTLKTQPNGDRTECDIPIPLEQAQEMHEQLCKKITRKTRRYITNSAEATEPSSVEHTVMQGDVPINKSTVRVRIATDKETKNPKGFLTIKTPSDTTKGVIDRMEWEYAIPPDDAKKLLGLSCENVFEKVRYHIDYKDQNSDHNSDHKVKRWTVDEFEDRERRKLHIVEVELDSVDEKPPLPPFVSKESDVSIKRAFSSRKIAEIIAKSDFTALNDMIRELTGIRIGKY